MFNCRLESNTCACFIENSWNFHIKCRSNLCLFIMTYLGLDSLFWHYLFWLIPDFYFGV